MLFLVACENDSLDKIESTYNSSIHETTKTTGFQQTRLYDEDAEVLTFKSQAVFTEFMRKIVKTPLSEIKQNPELQSFYSLNNFNLDIQNLKLQNLRVGNEELIPDDEDEIVFDPYFAAVLNKNREIEIEGIRFRIVKEGLVAYLDKELNRSKVTNFVENKLKNKLYDKSKSLEVDKDIVFYPQELFYNLDQFSDKKNQNARVICTSSGPGFFGHNHECFNEYAPGDFRIKGRTWSQSFGIYASIGSKTKHQWRRFGMWLSKDANLVRRKMNNFEVEFEDTFGGITIVDFAQLGSPISYDESYNHHEVVWVDDFQTAQFTIKPPFIKKLAKARKFKKYDTEHLINKNGSIAEVQLKYN